jgi:hypothetical protein
MESRSGTPKRKEIEKLSSVKGAHRWNSGSAYWLTNSNTSTLKAIFILSNNQNAEIKIASSKHTQPSITHALIDKIENKSK